MTEDDRLMLFAYVFSLTLIFYQIIKRCSCDDSIPSVLHVEIDDPQITIETYVSPPPLIFSNTVESKEEKAPLTHGFSISPK